ncbi:AAA family ATPase [Silvanigrella aquatica]|uniref:Uridine kinase n=1 Tax=Silvanigrella aquatica TaxID=1915309 RepID=A0A1L4D2U2_9BACT|nr:AAA family ATPase [Silvanigrella aquatica]APJ04523.1 uridine kinase [Silvanigrella aquatica]
MKIKVIGFSGVSGAGKTTLAKKLSQKLNASCLFWDDFDDISSSPDDYVQWYFRGSDYKEFNYVSLAHVLFELKKGNHIVHPVFKNVIPPTPFIVFDAPPGRLHEQTGQFIDYQVHIDVPLDISLVRRTMRDFKNENKTKEELIDDLEFYLNYSRPLFFDEQLKLKADCIINGCLSTEEQVEIVYQNLKVKKILIQDENSFLNKDDTNI